jgi:hypothetical protein
MKILYPTLVLLAFSIFCPSMLYGNKLDRSTEAYNHEPYNRKERDQSKKLMTQIPNICEKCIIEFTF